MDEVWGRVYLAEKRADLHEAGPARFMQRYFDYLD